MIRCSTDARHAWFQRVRFSLVPISPSIPFVHPVVHASPLRPPLRSPLRHLFIHPSSILPLSHFAPPTAPPKTSLFTLSLIHSLTSSFTHSAPSHTSLRTPLTCLVLLPTHSLHTQLTITYGSKIVLRTHRGTCLAARQGTPGAASTKGTKAGWRVVANGTSAGEATDNEAVFVVMNANFTRDAGPVKFGDAVAIASVAHNKYLGVNQVEDPATGAVQHGVTLRNNMGRAEKWTLLEAPRKADGRAAAARASSDGWMSGGGAGPSYVEACTRITLRSAAGHFLCAYGQADAIGGEGSAGGAAVDLLGDAALPVGLVDTDLDGLGGMDRLGGAESDRVTWHMMKETSPFVPEVRYQEPRWPFDDLMSVHRALLPM